MGAGGLFGKPAEKKDDKATPATTAPTGGLFGAPKADDKKEGSTGLLGASALGAKPGEGD